MIEPLLLDPADRPKPESATPPPGFWIAGQRVAPSSDETFESVDPTTGQSLATLGVAAQADIDAAVAAAGKTFRSTGWPDLDPSRREQLLLQAADVIETNAAELATLDSLEMGGTLPLTRWMIDHTVKVFRHFAGWPSKIYGQTAPSAPDQLQYTLRQPLGVVAGIAGWNGPVLQMGYKIAPALATGNTIVVKPSEQSSLSMLRLAELMAATDLPPGVFNVVTGPGRTTGDALMTHAGVSKVSFTGSTAIGRHVLESSGSDFRHVTLELGGKSPFVIFADADLEAAAATCATAFCANSGQACVAGTRIYVEHTARERFTELLTAATGDYGRALGDPFHPGARMGPIAFRGHYDEVRDYIATARRDGRVISGAEPVGGPGLFVPPALVTDIDESSPVVQQEIFGPVAVLGSFRTFDEAIALANETIYGLAASVWTRDTSQAMRAAAQLAAGTVWVNRGSQQSYGPLPFGGWKQSGLGREHGTQVLDAYTEVKSVVVQL